MTRLVFFTDPHLGKVLSSHTTPTSRERLKDDLFLQANGIVKDYSLSNQRTEIFCAGDLFDKFSNKEETLSQGAKILCGIDGCLAGNHDLIADTAELSSLQLLDSLVDGLSVVLTPMELYNDEDFYVYGIPHVTTQKQFEDELLKVKGQRNKTNILVLHCNYDSDFATQETSLNLTQETATFLLEQRGFNFILIGHEHNPRRCLGGRVIVMGNTHPTSFHDISDKFVWEFTPEGVTQNKVYSAAECYQKYTVQEFLALEELPDYLHWVDIQGTIEPGRSVELAKKVKALWQTGEQYAVRVQVTPASATPEAEGEVQGFLQVLGQIEAELNSIDPAMKNLFVEVLDEVMKEKETNATA